MRIEMMMKKITRYKAFDMYVRITIPYVNPAKTAYFRFLNFKLLMYKARGSGEIRKDEIFG